MPPCIIKKRKCLKTGEAYTKIVLGFSQACAKKTNYHLCTSTEQFSQLLDPKAM